MKDNKALLFRINYNSGVYVFEQKSNTFQYKIINNKFKNYLWRLYCEKANANQYIERIIVNIFKRYKENQDKNWKAFKYI